MRDELIMRFISTSSVDGLFELKLLNQNWFFSELEHLRSKVCDIPSREILPVTRNMNMTPDTESRDYHVRKDVWKHILEDESNLQVIRDLSTLDF